MVGHNIFEPPVDNLSTEDTSACCAAPGDDVDSIGAETFEDNTLDDVPREIVRMIGAYDTDCAGGCG